MFKEKFNLQYDEYKSMIQKMREKTREILTGGMNIDKLMKDKVEDYILIDEPPMPITVGSRTIFVGNMNFKNEHLFFNKWAEIIAALGAKIVNMELAEERRMELFKNASFHLLAEGKWMYEFLTMDKWLFKKLCKLIGKTVLKQQKLYMDDRQRVKALKWKNCSLRYFKKHINKETLIQICFLTYFYNFDAEKKNIQVVVEKMCMKALAETYMYSWLSNLGGATGKFLSAQAPSIDYAFRDVLNKPVPEKHRRNQNLTIPSNTEHKKEPENGKPDRPKPAVDKYTLFTLKKTDNEFWYAYIPMLNITIKNNKKTDLIEEQWEGKRYEEI